MRWLQFSLRDCFFVVTLAAMALAWRLDHSQLESTAERLEGDLSDQRWVTDSLASRLRQDGYEVAWTHNSLNLSNKEKGHFSYHKISCSFD